MLYFDLKIVSFFNKLTGLVQADDSSHEKKKTTFQIEVSILYYFKPHNHVFTSTTVLSQSKNCICDGFFFLVHYLIAGPLRKVNEVN